MKVRDLLKTMLFMTLVVLSFGPGVAFCFQGSDDDIEKGSIEIGASIVSIDNINIEPVVSSPTGIVSIDSITYEEADNSQGEIRIAASEELVSLPPETPKANETADKARTSEVKESTSEALRPVSMPGTRSTAVLQAPTITPVYNKAGGAVSPVHFNTNIIRHEVIDHTMPIMHSNGIGTTVLTLGPPDVRRDFLTFREKLLTKISSYAHQEVGVPYSWGVFSYGGLI